VLTIAVYGFVMAFISYYVINKFISPQTDSLVDEPVYPPSRWRGDTAESSSPIEGSTVEGDLKEPSSITKEKEGV